MNVQKKGNIGWSLDKVYGLLFNIRTCEHSGCAQYTTAEYKVVLGQRHPCKDDILKV
jgi:hypothetical protein